MIQTSKYFKKAVYAPSRMTTAKVRFEILDTGAFTDNTKSVTSEAIISRLIQVTNKIRSMNGRYETLEKDYFKLDGTFVLPPHADERLDDELGWWSNTLCDSIGEFDTYQVLEFNFTEEHSSMGLTIYFDMLNNEYASDFDIDIYDSTEFLINHSSVLNNVASRYIYIQQLMNYRKIIITVKRWCKPYRRAKIVEVDFGIIKEYEDNTLINMNLLQELDTTSNILPADEFKFTVDNSSRDFNVLNPQGFYSFLQQGQEVFTDIGVEIDTGEIEYIQIGKYYLKEWQSDEGTLTTTFTARDALDSLSDIESENVTERNINLHDLAEEVMIASGISDYVLSSNLNLIYTKGLYNKISYRNLLQLIATAGMCAIYTDNIGILHMKQLVSAKTLIESVDVTSEASISNKNQVINNILEPSYKIATLEKNRLKLDGSFGMSGSDMASYEVGWLSGELSGSDSIFENEQVLTLNISREHSSTNLEILFDTLNNEYATEFYLKAYDVTETLIMDEHIINSLNAYAYQNNLLSESRKIEVVIVKWSQSFARAKISEIGFDLPVGEITFDNIYTEPQIQLNRAAKTVEVTYYPSGNLNDKAVYTAVNNNIREGTALKIENSLVNTEEDAINLAEWILQENAKFATFKVNWRQNPSLGLSDKVSIESGYGTHNTAIITKQEYTYQGYLSGRTEAKGAL